MSVLEGLGPVLPTSPYAKALPPFEASQVAAGLRSSHAAKPAVEVETARAARQPDKADTHPPATLSLQHSATIERALAEQALEGADAANDSGSEAETEAGPEPEPDGEPEAQTA